MAQTARRHDVLTPTHPGRCLSSYSALTHGRQTASGTLAAVSSRAEAGRQPSRRTKREYIANMTARLCRSGIATGTDGAGR